MPDSSSRPSLASAATPVVLLGSALRFAYGKPVVLDLPTVQIPPGVTWVGGGEGRGKSTLLRLLAGELQAPGGVLQLQGHSFPAQAAAYRQQLFWMDPRTSVHDQIPARQFWQATAQRYPQWDAALLTQLQEVLGLGPHADKPLYMLSTGSKRKVWLAAALASGATLTLLDEPFAALDKASIRSILELLQEAAQHALRAWVVADYEAPAGVPLAHMIYLGD